MNRSAHIVWAVMLLAVLSVANPLRAESITVEAIALFNDKAMLSVNGGRGKIIKAGSTFKGVKLLESNTHRAIVEISGKQETIMLNGAAVLSSSLASSPAQAGKTEALLFSDSSGFFKADGEINGRRVPFIVDTGANLVVLSATQAESIGINYLEGQKGVATTASGRAPMYLIELDRISFSGISLRYVRAGVMEGSFPRIPLLGMSFLDKLDMTRTGDRMTLKKR